MEAKDIYYLPVNNKCERPHSEKMGKNPKLVT